MIMERSDSSRPENEYAVGRAKINDHQQNNLVYKTHSQDKQLVQT